MATCHALRSLRATQPCCKAEEGRALTTNAFTAVHHTDQDKHANYSQTEPLALRFSLQGMHAHRLQQPNHRSGATRSLAKSAMHMYTIG